MRKMILCVLKVMIIKDLHNLNLTFSSLTSQNMINMSTTCAM